MLFCGSGWPYLVLSLFCHSSTIHLSLSLRHSEICSSGIILIRPINRKVISCGSEVCFEARFEARFDVRFEVRFEFLFVIRFEVCFEVRVKVCFEVRFEARFEVAKLYSR